MSSKQDRLNELIEKLDILLRKQDHFAKEVDQIKREILQFKSQQTTESPALSDEVQTSTPLTEQQSKNVEATYVSEPSQEEHSEQSVSISPINEGRSVKKWSLEKFIGLNLINIIGIIITIIGVSIGARYAIEHQYLSPTVRIVLGYMLGLALAGIAFKLREKYESYSAVLLSGSLAIKYLITFAAFSLFSLFPQGIAFALMLLFTGFSVVLAISYNRQVIGHIGLVGAYAIPFLVNQGEGSMFTLFTYISIINIGILAISIKKYWKPLYYVAFGFTWFIYFVWMVINYEIAEHFTPSLIFLTIIFLTFYVTFLIFKLIQKEKFVISDVVLVLLNAFFFYLFGYATIEEHSIGEGLLGAFTLANAAIHLGFGLVLYRNRLADRNLFYLVSGLVLVFITIAIPVQLEGNWVTLLWAGEAALLFWIGRTKGEAFYEKLSYILLSLAFVSICHDWSAAYEGYNPASPASRITPITNIHFLTSMLTVGAFAFVSLLYFSQKHPKPKEISTGLSNFASFLIPSVLGITLYFAFKLEIGNYWQQIHFDSRVSALYNQTFLPTIIENPNILKFKTLWTINYSLIFILILTLFNTYRIKSRLAGTILLGFNILVLLVFLSQGLYTLSELRIIYLEQFKGEYFDIGLWNIYIRYISIAFASLLLAASYLAIREKIIRGNLAIAMDLIIHTAIVWILSSELISWMDMLDSSQSYKLGLSILWGAYSLLLIVVGLWKKKTHLRIGAISLFGVTLLKLFIYDISHLSTIHKTIVLLSLGTLLLIISFLYNKYKHIISDD